MNENYLKDFQRLPRINRPYDDGRHHEWHVTVAGDPLKWRGFCAGHGLKPLWIELNNFDTQLMCEAGFDPTDVIRRANWDILRIKHEVQTRPIDITTHDDQLTRYLPEALEAACYYEVHFKMNGKFQPRMPHTSRDLFRENRWYLTHRSNKPFDPQDIHKRIFPTEGDVFLSGFDTYEYEACLLDTNPELDRGWV